MQCFQFVQQLENHRERSSLHLTHKENSHMHKQTICMAKVFLFRDFTQPFTAIAAIVKFEREKPETVSTKLNFLTSLHQLVQTKSTSGKTPMFFWRKTDKKHSRRTANIRHTEKKWILLIN